MTASRGLEDSLIDAPFVAIAWNCCYAGIYEVQLVLVVTTVQIQSHPLVIGKYQIGRSRIGRLLGDVCESTAQVSCGQCTLRSTSLVRKYAQALEEYQ